MKWERVMLGDICHPKQWKTLSKAEMSHEGFPVYGANGRIGFSETYTHEKPVILVGCRGSCGTVHVTEPKSYANGNAMALDALNERRVYLMFLEKYLRYRGFSDRISGTSQPQIIRANIVKVDVPLPPLSEQKRIAEILNAADALRAKRREALAQLDTLLQSTFLDMFGDMFGDPFDGRSDYKHVPFGDLTERITYGFTCPMSHVESGIPILTAKNVLDGSLDMVNVHFADQREFDALTEKSKPSPGDILITKDGSIGRCVVVPKVGPICINQSVALVIPRRSVVIPDYISAYIRSASVQQRIQRMGKGNALKHLQITELAKFPTVIPPFDLQRRFAAIVESVERQKAKMRAHLAELDALFASLQSRAFSGTL